MSEEGQPSPWARLGVRADATPEQVREAFLSRVRYAHPDQGGDDATFRSVWSAYQTARAQTGPRDPARRRPSDGTLSKGRKIRSYMWLEERPENHVLGDQPALASPLAATAPSSRRRPVGPASPSSFAAVLHAAMAGAGVAG